MAYLITDDLERKSWDNRLRKQALLPDFFTDFGGVRDSDTPQSLPQGITVKYMEKGGNISHTIPLLKALNGAGGTGRDRAKGNEEDQVVASFSIFANSWFHTVSTQNYGVDAQNAGYLKLLTQVTPQLGEWFQQRKGKYTREALCQIYSDNLTVAPTNLVQGINPNFNFIGGTTTTINTACTYDPTLATFVTDIVGKRPTANSAQYNGLNLDALNQIIKYAAEDVIIKPLKISGKDRYILTMSHRQKNFLMDPNATTSNLFSLFTAADFRGKNRALKYEMWEYGQLLLVVDPRTPICEVTGATVTFSYKDVGNVDARDLSASNDNFDVCMLLGNEAVYEYETESLHYEEDDDDYKRTGGIGAFTTSGCIMTHYDEQTNKTADSITQQYSAIFLAGTNA